MVTQLRKASSRQRATHGQMDDAYQPIRARALLTLCYKNKYSGKLLNKQGPLNKQQRREAGSLC